MEHRELIFGSRTWTDKQVIHAVIDELIAEHGDDLIVIHGGHWEGADNIADRYCIERGVQRIVMPAAWKGPKRGGAGPYRNGLLLSIGRPHHATGFRMPGKSNGTDDMANRCRGENVPLEGHTP